MAISQGVRAQADLSTNREKLSFAADIALLDAESSPFTTILNKFPRKTAGSRTHRFLDDVVFPETDQIDGEQTAADTTILVDNGGRFAKCDLVRVNSSGEVMLVLSVSVNTLTVDRDYGEQDTTPGYTARADTLPDNGYLTIIGNTFEQGHTIAPIKNTVEVERYQHLQQQRTSFGISETVAASELYGEQEWPYEMRKKRTEHHRKLEYQHIWGLPVQGDKGLYDGTNNTNPNAAFGVDFFIGEYASADKKTTQADITQSEFLDHLESTFEHSHKLVCLCPRLLGTALDFWGISKLNTFVGGEKFGMKIRHWDSNDGEVIFVTERLVKDPAGTDGVSALFLNMGSVALTYYSNIGATKMREPIRYVNSDGATLMKAEWDTISGIEMRKPDEHSRIDGMISYSL